MPDIERTVAIQLIRVVAVDGLQERPVVGRLRQRMRVGVAENVGEAMPHALGERDLEAVVVRAVVVAQPVNNSQIGKLGIKWGSGLFGTAIGGTIVVAGRRTRETLSSGTVGIRRVSPTRAEAIDELRLIQIGNAQ